MSAIHDTTFFECKRSELPMYIAHIQDAGFTVTRIENTGDKYRVDSVKDDSLMDYVISLIFGDIDIDHH